MICPRCGKFIDESAKVCYNCGYYTAGMDPKGRQYVYEHKELLSRNRFISFWLWASLIFIALVTSLLLYLLLSAKPLYLSPPDQLFIAVDPTRLVFPIGLVVAGVLAIWGYVNLLLWRRSGFIIVTVDTIFSTLLTLGILPSAYWIIQAVIAILVLWGILHLSPGGITYWEAMALRQEKPRNPEKQ